MLVDITRFSLSQHSEDGRQNNGCLEGEAAKSAPIHSQIVGESDTVPVVRGQSYSCDT